jgi:hypothetical protein
MVVLLASSHSVEVGMSSAAEVLVLAAIPESAEDAVDDVLPRGAGGVIESFAGVDVGVAGAVDGRRMIVAVVRTMPKAASKRPMSLLPLLDCDVSGDMRFRE